MSKAVLISLQPKWCELIFRGKKTIEIRKTKPKLETPFKCYIYQSKSRDRLIEVSYHVYDCPRYRKEKRRKPKRNTAP